MPLVRFEVRNEYALGQPELYSEAEKEDPKAVLDAVAVSGLVGILRQLGDLAEFAAEVFHGLQEQVMITSSRSHKLMVRVQHIETAIPHLEKAIFAQRSHLHFAYTSGSNWHAQLRREQNHFIYDDFPRFIMNSYGECRSPPRLHLLDKFDSGGPGSCLKRYSDPTFFKRASFGPDKTNIRKIPRDKKPHRTKTKRSWQSNGQVSRGTPLSDYNFRMHSASFKVDGQTSPLHTVLTSDATLKSDMGEQSNLFNTRTESGHIECIFYPNYSLQSEEHEWKASISSRMNKHCNDAPNFGVLKEKTKIEGSDIQNSVSQDHTGPSSTCVNWEENTEVVKSLRQLHDHDGIPERYSTNHELNAQDRRTVDFRKTAIVGPDLKETSRIVEPSWKQHDYDETAEIMDLAWQRHDYDEDAEILEPSWRQHAYDETSEVVEPPWQQRAYDEIAKIDKPSWRQYSYYETADVVDPSWQKRASDEPAHVVDPSWQQCASDVTAETVEPSWQQRASDETADIMEPSWQEHAYNETAGIVGPSWQQHAYDETAEIKATDNLLDAQKTDDVNLRTVNPTEIQCGHEQMPTSMPGGQPHEIESEPEHFVDALNTIESESETDVDYQTKREVERQSCLKNKATNHVANGIATEHSDHHLPNMDFQIASYSSTNRTTSTDRPNLASPDSHTSNNWSSGGGISEIKPNLTSVEYHDHDLSSLMAGKPLDPGNSLETKSRGSGYILDCSNVVVIVGDESISGSGESNSQASMSDKVIKSPYDPHKFLAESSIANSTKFWTNGGLLGLEPSKPPHFSVSNAICQDYVAKCKDGTLNFSNETNILEHDRHTGKEDTCVQSSKFMEDDPSSQCFTSVNVDQEDRFSSKKSSWNSLSADLNVKLDKSSNSFNQSSNLSQGHSCSETIRVSTGNEHFVASDARCTKAVQEAAKSSARIFDIGNQLLANGFQRKLSLGGDNLTNPVGYPGHDTSERKGRYQTSAKQASLGMENGHFGCNSPVFSPSSSPPLEHMKISFQPIDGFETSKLKLKFPDGINCHENNGDMFPSFQLVPELQDVGSDTDDDTFCRSSPYLSDDCVSGYSEPCSEQWESDESPTRNGHELYDVLRRVSSSESVSSSPEIGGTAQRDLDEIGVKLSSSGNFGGLPSSDALNASISLESLKSSDIKETPECCEPMPTPLSLPPLQRCAVKPSNAAESKQDAVSRDPNYEFDLKHMGSTISHQPKPAPIKPDQIAEASHTLKSKHPDWQDPQGQKGPNQITNGEVMDEKEDFLHQIRTKSFSLRRTATVKQTITASPHANTKVTAILEKANAIRQAVGSDDGEDDDNWSDT